MLPAQTAQAEKNRSSISDGYDGLPSAPWALEEGDVARWLGTDPGQGLDDASVQRRRARFGENRLRAHEKRSWRSVLAAQFRSVIVALLVIAALVAFLFQEALEGWAIVAVILINTGIGFGVELRAVRSMEALYRLGRTEAVVRRGGQLFRIPAEDLVPGDLVVIEGGDVIAADMRIVRSSRLQADESALTGESLPVDKQVASVEKDAVLAERLSMLHKGTSVTRGSGEAIVVATGMETELGAITALVMEADKEATPLEQKLEKLGRKLIVATVFIAVLVSVMGVVAGKELMLMIQTGLSLAVAAIPEGLPIVATLALASGVRKMAQQNALVNRLSSVETLGATEVICTDKTGTLTENKMTVTDLVLPIGTVKPLQNWVKDDGARMTNGEEAIWQEAMKTLALCNTIDPKALGGSDDGAIKGDPMEVALARAALEAGMNPVDLAARFPEVKEEAFDPEVKMMATYNRVDAAFRVSVKGAPEAVIAHCRSAPGLDGDVELSEADRTAWLEKSESLAAKGLRVIALAAKTVAGEEDPPYSDLQFQGLAGLADPPRSDVAGAVQACREAGIQVVMVTGDHPTTALHVARDTGVVSPEALGVQDGQMLEGIDRLSEEGRTDLMKTRVFARVSPRQKLELIRLHQDAGRIVAMTGDGVNDAPALKKADIGIAMGQRGTEVAREAADMVLLDDAFTTIVEAVAQGRTIFSNIRRFVFYLMSCNVSEVMVVGLAAMAGTALPVMPIQILFLNLVTDVFPALALGFGKQEAQVLKRPPRNPEHPILERSHWIGIVSYSLIISASVLGALMLATHWLNLPRTEAVSVSFLTLALVQLWHVFNMRSAGSNVFRNEITRNPYVWLALLLCFSLLAAAAGIPGFARVLQVLPPDARGWGVILGMSLVPLFFGQLSKVIMRWRHGRV